MPFYPYECEDCCEKFSLKRRIKNRDDPATCPNCGSKQTDRKISNVNTGTGSSGGNAG